MKTRKVVPDLKEFWLVVVAVTTAFVLYPVAVSAQEADQFDAMEHTEGPLNEPWLMVYEKTAREIDAQIESLDRSLAQLKD
jgi:hypothetical protein